MTPRIPIPYRTTAYARPTAPLYFAQRIEVPDGAKLATFVYGPDGGSMEGLRTTEPVLVLHGNGGSHGTFARVIDALCTARRYVIALDSRAQGQSSRGTLPLTYERMTEDAVHALDALSIGAVHVAGYSDGGIESLLLARDYADRVLSVVASGANLTPEGVIDEPEWDTPGSAAANLAWSQYMQTTAFPAQIDSTLLPSAEETQLSGELLQLMLDEPHIDAASLNSISCPVCVMVGEHDCITDEETQAIARNISGSRLVVVPNVGHSVPRLAPDSMALQILTNILLTS